MKFQGFVPLGGAVLAIPQLLRNKSPGRLLITAREVSNKTGQECASRSVSLHPALLTRQAPHLACGRL